MLNYLSVGYVLKPQGIKGEIKVESLTDNLERFDKLSVLYIKCQEGYDPIEIVARRYSGKFVYLSIKGYDDMNAAEKLRGQYLWIPREEAKKLPEGSFFIADLIRCNVYTQEEEHLGSIKEVIHTGSNDVYVIKGVKGEILIPALKKVVLNVDIEAKRMTVDSLKLEGLLPDED
ncbi:MAG TPA: ribosome maturation factor RimM [Clostridia bacterium]|nr:ribosome maturation factor RimM [Clostridia bacterium]